MEFSEQAKKDMYPILLKIAIRIAKAQKAQQNKAA